MNKTAQFTQGPRIERTPGKWTVQHNNNDDTTHIVANDPHVGMDMVAEIYRVSAYEGNAALIAAAPAMYEALQDIESYTELGLNSDEPKHWEASLQDILGIVRDALAQAEGRQLR